MAARTEALGRGLAAAQSGLPQPPPGLLPLPPPRAHRGPAAAAWQQPLPKAFYLHAATLALGAIFQTMVIRREWASAINGSGAALGWQALLAAAHAAAFLAILRWPLVYWRHRCGGPGCMAPLHGLPHPAHCTLLPAPTAGLG